MAARDPYDERKEGGSIELDDDPRRVDQRLTDALPPVIDELIPSQSAPVPTRLASPPALTTTSMRQHLPLRHRLADVRFADAAEAGRASRRRAKSRPRT